MKILFKPDFIVSNLYKTKLKLHDRLLKIKYISLKKFNHEEKNILVNAFVFVLYSYISSAK